MIAHAHEHFRGIEPFPILLDLICSQAGEVIAVSRSTAQEERPEYDVVYLSVLVPQSTIRCQVHQLALIVADQGDRIIELDGLDQTAHDFLHRFQRSVNVPHFRSALRLNY